MSLGHLRIHNQRSARVHGRRMRHRQCTPQEHGMAPVCTSKGMPRRCIPRADVEGCTMIAHGDVPEMRRALDNDTAPGGGGATTTGADATSPPRYLSKLAEGLGGGGLAGGWVGGVLAARPGGIKVCMR